MVLDPMKKFRKNLGFTLAEVLITLGIIGVVAAMVLPTLIQQYHNVKVESQLKKIHAVMNQAIRLSEQENGPKDYWLTQLRTKAGIEKYILPYLKYMKVTEDAGSSDKDFVSIYFANGTILKFSKRWTGQSHFYTVNDENCQRGVCVFIFTMNGVDYFESNGINNVSAHIKYSVNYGCFVNGTFCAAYIQQNNWKIPKDYPWKVR